MDVATELFNGSLLTCNTKFALLFSLYELLNMTVLEANFLYFDYVYSRQKEYIYCNENYKYASLTVDEDVGYVICGSISITKVLIFRPQEGVHFQFLAQRSFIIISAAQFLIINVVSAIL